MSSSRYWCILCWISGNGAWTRTSTWGMNLGARWIELAWRNQVKSTLWIELRTVIIKIADRNHGAVDPVEEWPELRTVIIKAGSANLNSKSGFSQGSKGKWITSSQTSLNTMKNLSQAKRRWEHHWRRRTQEPGEKSKIFLMYYFFYSFLILCCCLNMNLYVIFDMIYS
jgi:hypothetical protein